VIAYRVITLAVSSDWKDTDVEKFIQNHVDFFLSFQVTFPEFFMAEPAPAYFSVVFSTAKVHYKTSL